MTTHTHTNTHKHINLITQPRISLQEMRKLQKEARIKEIHEGRIITDGTDVLSPKSNGESEKARKEMREKQRQDFQSFKAAQRAVKGIVAAEQVSFLSFFFKF